MKRWEIQLKIEDSPAGQAGFQLKIEDLLKKILKNRGVHTKNEIEKFLSPPNPYTLTPGDVEIDKASLKKAIKRILTAIENKESIVVYADYDADGICAGAVMWEVLHGLGAHVMPYIPHRVEEGYGLSIRGIDAVREQFDPTLIITVDHGITAWEKVEYAVSQKIDVIITDHHVKPKKLPRCTIVHTTQLSGVGVAWFVAKEVLSKLRSSEAPKPDDLLSLVTIGTIADMVPLVGPNRSITRHGLAAINKTTRVGLNALIADAALVKGNLGTYEISHILAPRLNAMGRLEHAMDALRLLCTHRKERAMELAQKLDLTNRERQQLTMDTTTHVLKGLALRSQGRALKKLLFVVDESYNQGVIGLVAGKLVEEYYRPTIVVSKGEVYSKASARSINGFNIVEAIRSCSDILVDVGGHPMAAGFTVETKHLLVLQQRLEELAEKELDEAKLTRVLKIDAEIPLELATEELWKKLQGFQPFGLGNPEPVFAARGITIIDARLVGADGKHLKLKINQLTNSTNQTNLTNSLDAIAFNQGILYGKLQPNTIVDIAYALALDTWNGNKKLQLKIKDIHFPEPENS